MTEIDAAEMVSLWHGLAGSVIWGAIIFPLLYGVVMMRPFTTTRRPRLGRWVTLEGRVESGELIPAPFRESAPCVAWYIGPKVGHNPAPRFFTNLPSVRPGYSRVRPFVLRTPTGLVRVVCNPRETFATAIWLEHRRGVEDSLDFERQALAAAADRGEDVSEFERFLDDAADEPVGVVGERIAPDAMMLRPGDDVFLSGVLARIDESPGPSSGAVEAAHGETADASGSDEHQHRDDAVATYYLRSRIATHGRPHRRLRIEKGTLATLHRRYRPLAPKTLAAAIPGALIGAGLYLVLLRGLLEVLLPGLPLWHDLERIIAAPAAWMGS